MRVVTAQRALFPAAHFLAPSLCKPTSSPFCRFMIVVSAHKRRPFRVCHLAGCNGGAFSVPFCTDEGFVHGIVVQILANSFVSFLQFLASRLRRRRSRGPGTDSRICGIWRTL